MNLLDQYVPWLFPLIGDESVQSALRFCAAAFTIVFSSLTFYLKLKERSDNRPPGLALSATSWDLGSGFPIYPLPTNLKVAPFPFVAADLSTRRKPTSGWFTSTELRIWNSGGGVICGSPTYKRTHVYLCIPYAVGEYDLGSCASNDTQLKFGLGKAVHSLNAEMVRMPIYFDYLRSGKGIVLSVTHDSANSDGIEIDAFSDQAPVPMIGTHHPIKQSVVSFMNRVAYVLLMPTAAFSAVMFYVGNAWSGAAAAFVAWLFIISIYLHLRFTVSPENLSWDNPNLKYV